MEHTKSLALQLLYSYPKPGRLEALLPRVRYRLQRDVSRDGWSALAATGFALWAAVAGSYALCVLAVIWAVAFGRTYLVKTRPLTPRPFEHEWVRFLRNLPQDPQIRALVATEFANVRKDEEYAELIAKSWLVD